MLEARQHNRNLSAQRQAEAASVRDYGTEVDEKSTRTIGTMSEPIKTRNSGNEAQPQSSVTETSNLKDRHLLLLSPPKNYSHRTKDRPQMVSAETDTSLDGMKSPHRTKDGPQMISAETDTSLDGMKPPQHQDHQSGSPATREYGTTTNAEKQHSSETSHPINLNKRSSDSDYHKLDSNPLKHQDNQPSSTRKNYQLRPVPNKSYINNYEEISSKHDESISPPLNHSFDRPKEYTPKPFTDADHRQASPTLAQRSDEEEQYPKTTFHDETINEKYIRELPGDDSVSIPSTTVMQPDTLPHSRGQNKSPTHQNHNPLDNSRKIRELPLHYGQEQEILSRRDSLLLNFGTSHINYQSPLNEVATPFKIRYIQETDDEFSTNNSNIRTSTLKRDALRSKTNRILLLPVLNSSRTNGSFYLATSPTLRSQVA